MDIYVLGGGIVSVILIDLQPQAELSEPVMVERNANTLCSRACAQVMVTPLADISIKVSRTKRHELI